jgi:hypothetical protein
LADNVDQLEVTQQAEQQQVRGTCPSSSAQGGAAALPSQGLDLVKPQHRLAMPYIPIGAVLAATEKSERAPNGARCGADVTSWARADVARRLNGAGIARTRMTNVFVAQLPFDMPLETLQELADTLVPAPPIRIVLAAPHLRNRRAYDGCAFLRMPEADAHRFVAALHKRVLFDVDGAWYAADAAQQTALTGYCTWAQDKPVDERRRLLPRPTPFSAMTAEFALKSGARIARPRIARAPGTAKSSIDAAGESGGGSRAMPTFMALNAAAAAAAATHVTGDSGRLSPAASSNSSTDAI